MRGAWLWPAFVVLTLAGGLVLLELPFYDAAPDDLYGTLLVAGVLNLVAVALVAPFVARLLRRRRPELPRDVSRNYAGTALVCAVAALLVLGGVLHRPAVRAQERDAAAQFSAVRNYVERQEPGFRAGLAQADTLRLGDDLYRTCVPGPDPRKPLCLMVTTDQAPAGVSRDPDRTPNAAFQR